eukprot:11212441-Lingulodinium_polyedra.AAC.1
MEGSWPATLCTHGSARETPPPHWRSSVHPAVPTPTPVSGAALRDQSGRRSARPLRRALPSLVRELHA